MAGPAPKTRNWRARENKHEPSGLHIIVSGEVEVSATTRHPQLAEAPHVGKVLPLDLTITESGLGAELVVWVKAHFQRQVSAEEFDHVEIRWGDEVIATVPVIDDTEHHALASTQVKAQDTVAKVKTVKTKKAAPKKAAVKAARKVAKKAAKKAAKKTAKKTAGKTTRKTAKKTSKKKAAPKRLTPKKKAKKSKKRR